LVRIVYDGSTIICCYINAKLYTKTKHEEEEEGGGKASPRNVFSTECLQESKEIYIKYLLWHLAL